MPPLWSAPVRFVECDMQGVVFNAHYLVWADEAVDSWWRRCGVDWAQLTARGVSHLVVASSLQWRSSARWGDTVQVEAELDAIGRTSLTVGFVIRVGDRVCCQVSTTYVCVVDGGTAPWPDEVRQLVSES